MGLTKTELYAPADVAEAELLKALGHPARLAIVRHLLSQCTCVNGGFVALTGLSQPSVSRHLGVLVEAGLVSSKNGHYCIRPQGWRALQAQFAPLVEQAIHTKPLC